MKQWRRVGGRERRGLQVQWNRRNETNRKTKEVKRTGPKSIKQWKEKANKELKVIGKRLWDKILRTCDPKCKTTKGT